MDKTLAVKQAKFSNGMISKHLRGDVSHPKYAASVASIRNWLPIPQGALTKRPGFKLVAPVKDSAYAPRIKEFVFSDNQTYVLEFGNLYVRFYQRSQYVGNDGNLHLYGDAYAGGYYELVTPYQTAFLPYLKFKQVGDVVTITYAGQAALGGAGIAPQDLRHTSSAPTPWTIGPTPLAIPAGVVTWPGGAPVDGVGGYISTGVATGPTWNKGERAFWLDANAPPVLTEWICIQDGTKGTQNNPPNAAVNAGGTAIQGTLYWMPAVDLAHPAVKTSWVQTAVVQRDSDGVVFESQPSPILVINSSLSSDRQRPIGMSPPTVAAGYTLLFNKLYRATTGGVFGWINDVTPASLVAYPNGPGVNVFLDDGRAPDFTRQPPKGTNPFLTAPGFSYPAIVGYLDQRRLWGGSQRFPAGIALSKAGDLYNYDGSQAELVPGSAADAMFFTLASEVMEQARAFVPMRKGLILTAQGEWAVSGQGGGPIARNSLDVKRQSRWGSSWLDPLPIGTGILFNTAKSNMVRDFYPLYGLYTDIWDGQDLSVMARDLFDLHTLVDWCFQSTPYPVVWSARDDGKLLSLTYQHAPPSFGQQLSEGIVAWGLHGTGEDLGHTVERLCCVPEPPEDAVYAVIKRGASRYIERMDSPVLSASPYVSGVPDVRYGTSVDACLTYDGHAETLGYGGVNVTIDSTTNPGSGALADYAIGSRVRVTTAANPFVASDADAPYGSAFVFDPENVLLMNNFNVNADGVPYPAVSGRIVLRLGAGQVDIELDAPMTGDMIVAWRAGRSAWAVARGQVTVAHLSTIPIDGLDPVGLRLVQCLVDGEAQVPGNFAAGVVYLNTPGVVVKVGIGYNADVSLLDLYLTSAEVRNRFKLVKRLGFEMANTRDVWGGASFDQLSRLIEREARDLIGLHTGYFEVFVTGGSAKTGAAVARHFYPTPATLSAVLREVVLGES